MENKKPFFSRRRLLKVGTALFAFIPSVLYLKEATPALAYTTCADEPLSIGCTDWFKVTEPGTGRLRWARLCSAFGTWSNEMCGEWVEWGSYC